MSDEAQAEVQPSTTPARYEPDPHLLEQGGKIGLNFYRLILPREYIKDGGVNRAFGLDRLYVSEAPDFSKRALGVVGSSVESLFAYKLSREDEAEIGKAVGEKYPPSGENPDFRLTTADILVATLKAANRILGPKVIEKAQADAAAIGLEASNDQELRRGWASFYQGVVESTANELKNGRDAVGERKRVEEMAELISKAKEEERKEGEDIKERIGYGLKLREEAANSLRQFGGEVWR